jgi:hypothetical protein
MPLGNPAVDLGLPTLDDFRQEELITFFMMQTFVQVDSTFNPKN